MDGQNLLALMNRQTWLKQVKDTNQYTKKFGLTLSEKDTEILLAEKNHPLKTERRVVFCRKSSLNGKQFLTSNRLFKIV